MLCALASLFSIDRKTVALVAGLFLSFGCLPAWASTPAGTVIDNVATLSYTIVGEAPQTTSSNTVSLQVDELIGAKVTCQEASLVAVSSPDLHRVLTYLLTNPGNGTETYSLTQNNNSIVNDDFNPDDSTVPIYLETNGTPGLQTGAGGDTLFSGTVTLGAEKSILVYISDNIPSSLATGNTGYVDLTGASTTPGAAGAAPGTALPGQGDGGVTGIVGLTQAKATASCGYIVSGLSVVITKTAAVVGGGDAYPGKTLAYTIKVDVQGQGVAKGLVVNDPLPAEVSYVANTLAVDSSPRTDSSTDSDNAQFSGNTVTVTFGDTTAPITHVITFNATVN